MQVHKASVNQCRCWRGCSGPPRHLQLLFPLPSAPARMNIWTLCSELDQGTNPAEMNPTWNIIHFPLVSLPCAAGQTPAVAGGGKEREKKQWGQHTGDWSRPPASPQSGRTSIKMFKPLKQNKFQALCLYILRGKKIRWEVSIWRCCPKPSESKLLRGGRRGGGGRLVVSGSRPVIPVVPPSPTGTAGTARHGTAQSPRHVSALRGTPPKFSCASSSQNLSSHLLHLAWVMPRPLQDNLPCNEDRQTPNVTAAWKYPRAPHVKLFSSLSLAFQSPPTTHLFQPSPGVTTRCCGLSALRCQSILMLWRTRDSCKLTGMTSLQKLQLCTLCHLWLTYDSEDKLYSKPWKLNPSIYATS